MDITFLLNYIDMVTLGICLCVGYVLKTAFTRFQNKYIPLCMLVLGMAISVLTHLHDIQGAIVLGGMISGLASTGLYEMMRNLLDREGKAGK